MAVKLWKLCFIKLVKGLKHYSLYSASHPAYNESTESHPTAIASASGRLRIAESLHSGPADQMAQKGAESLALQLVPGRIRLATKSL